MFGRLTDPVAGAFHALTNEPIVLYTCLVVVALAVVILAAITLLGWWGILWRNWITSVDHKRVGIMYIVLAIVMTGENKV